MENKKILILIELILFSIILNYNVFADEETTVECIGENCVEKEKIISDDSNTEEEKK